MKLLIITQVVDVNHPILGFFHRWIEEFAKHVDHIHVIALQVGEYNLPQNVTVHSLGKEHGVNIFQKITRFYKLIFSLRKEYDSVFVHMNPEYIMLAGWWWRLTKKKIGLWYNHTVGSFWLRIAQPLTIHIFHTSPYAYTAHYKNAQRMPAGIDTEVFRPLPDVAKNKRRLYFQGRLSPAKNVHVLLEAFEQLHTDGLVEGITLVGPEEKSYTEPLKRRYAKLIEYGAINFYGPVPNKDTPAFFASHAISVNLTAKGNYDKTVLESIACGTPCIVASPAFSDVVPDEWMLKMLDAHELAQAIRTLLTAPEAEQDTVLAAAQRTINERESLEVLAKKIYNTYT